MTPIRNDTNTILKRSFYKRNTVVVAKDLLGKMLVSTVGNVVVSGTITETEAYGAENDPASHAFRGITERNKAMFGTVGCAYVYFIYGMHYCLNTVARDDADKAGAVLIRAIEPIDGMEIMKKRRNVANTTTLVNCPAKLAQALNVTKSQYGIDLTTRGRLYICRGETSRKITASARIGVRDTMEWNFRLV